MQKKGAQREAILHLLEEEGGVTEQSVRTVSKQTGIPEADIWGAGTFYSLIREPGERRLICQGLTCKMAGSDALHAELAAEGVPVEAVSCLGQCDRAPVYLEPDRTLVSRAVHFWGITPDDPTLPINLAGADSADYAALAKARSMTTAQILDEIEASGLQGRGGAGFPAHIKWRSVVGEAETERYLVCNADEGEPGTFKDREVLLRRPHLMMEGLAIAAHTIGASEIYIYIRGEFAAERSALEAAIAAAEIPVPVHIVAGHGAYICGEETALLESLEGKRGMPRLKPPYPTQMGFRNKPTLIHNVETLACLPAILLRGGDAFRAAGRTEAGSKLYCISGHVACPGVYELPLGVSLDELVEAAGGYLGTPMAFSPGGASSGFLPMRLRSHPLDFKGLGKVGSMLGSAGVVVLNDTVDLAWAAKQQAIFFEDESCGQCAPCRIGTRYVRQSIDRYLTTGDPVALQHIEDVSWEMDQGSICGLGQIAALPLTSARTHFPETFGHREIP
ncbi:MAG: NADH-ubiquinone oxidoreductase-F iron-sulfur binding region domain-containing protein [Myxococcota bacterium]|nr:NADH-ubiquinone oxidoreductase-F iron-sulfur binding region domain-containing protein [Myxococcota bacterium]